MNCPACSKALTGTFKFCPYCGRKIENDTPQALLRYIQEQKDRVEGRGQDAGRWIAWEKWLTDVISLQLKGLNEISNK